MALNPPVPGLRRIRNGSNSVAKVQINVASGDELEVSEPLAAQLKAASGAFQDVDPKPAKAPAAKKPRKSAT